MGVGVVYRKILLFLVSVLTVEPMIAANHVLADPSHEKSVSDAFVPARKGSFFGYPERFNRYYTDDDYKAEKVLYVSPSGHGSGEKDSPMAVEKALAAIEPGTQINFTRGRYSACWELGRGDSGTYDAPVILRADPEAKEGEETVLQCCSNGRGACFNLEGANYVAVQGFVLVKGDYGIRSVGMGYEGKAHQNGIAILNNLADGQFKDGFFTGQSDWIVLDGNTGRGAGRGDGHGIYLSNGGDWMIARGNELYDNTTSDFQINADPESTCEKAGIDVHGPMCHGNAEEGLGQGISEFVLVENNFFHSGFRASSTGPNFTSVRNSVVRNNIIGFYTRHGTSFWQETDNPRLGSSNNLVEHNLFIGVSSRRHVLQFINHSVGNRVRNNLLLGVASLSGRMKANPGVVLLELDRSTRQKNQFEGNVFVGGKFQGYSPGRSNIRLTEFDPEWFIDFPADGKGSIEDFRPAALFPAIDTAARLPSSPLDMTGTARSGKVDPGPLEH